jgi:hypothetical protein
MKPEQMTIEQRRKIAQMVNVLFNESEQRLQHQILQKLSDEKGIIRTYLYDEILKAYAEGYTAGHAAAMAEIAEQRNHAVPKIDPHPTFDFPAFEEQRNGERMTTGNKRKSPEPHNVIHHSDDFWLEICREYQTMRHRNPNLTQADFVRIKSNPRIKIKTFNAKLLQLTKTGAFTHKPRTRRIK